MYTIKHSNTQSNNIVTVLHLLFTMTAIVFRTLACVELNSPDQERWPQMSIRDATQINNNDNYCFYYHSWRNNVVIAFGTLSSFLTQQQRFRNIV